MAKLGFKPSLSLVMEFFVFCVFFFFYRELSLFGNSREIVIWEMHAVGSYRPVLWGVGTVFTGKECQQKGMFSWSLSSKLFGERFLADILWSGGKFWSSVNQAFTEMSLLVLKFHFFEGAYMRFFHWGGLSSGILSHGGRKWQVDFIGLIWTGNEDSQSLFCGG